VETAGENTRPLLTHINRIGTANGLQSHISVPCWGAGRKGDAGSGYEKFRRGERFAIYRIYLPHYRAYLGGKIRAAELQYRKGNAAAP
jgi:hypothetical protein